MLTWAVILFVISIVAAILGFTGIAAATSFVARVLFFIFLIGFVIFLVAGFVNGEAGGAPPGAIQFR